jgi:hypothetical protein
MYISSDVSIRNIITKKTSLLFGNVKKKESKFSRWTATSKEWRTDMTGTVDNSNIESTHNDNIDNDWNNEQQKHFSNMDPNLSIEDMNYSDSESSSNFQSKPISDLYSFGTDSNTFSNLDSVMILFNILCI